MKVCPHCKRYQLTIFDTYMLKISRPNKCPNCSGLYTPSEKSSWIIAILLFGLLGLIIVTVLFAPPKNSSFKLFLVYGLSLAFIFQVAKHFIVEPKKYVKDSLYTKRSPIGNILFYIIIPILGVSTIIYLLSYFLGS